MQTNTQSKWRGLIKPVLYLLISVGCFSVGHAFAEDTSDLTLGGVADHASVHVLISRNGPTSARAHDQTPITSGAYCPHGITGGEQ